VSAPTAATTELDRVADLVRSGDVVVLTGAGISTESGIPDYRGPSGSLRRHTPMTYQDFLRDALGRHRYWARSHLGWRAMAGARPNAGHAAVADLQVKGLLSGLITQNVDGLHQAAGTRDVVELHGGLDRVICLGCSATTTRAQIADRLVAANPDFAARAATLHPDGDAELPDSELDSFRMIDCAACGAGPLKPDVVFFGESVPKDRVEHCFRLVDTARSLLVLGSSLTVYSGYRFAVRAARAGIPVAIVNQGPTRGDHLATVKEEAPLGPTLSALASALAALAV
jgi:NAD-dependent SIR2 family protein deacetylase